MPIKTQGTMTETAGGERVTGVQRPSIADVLVKARKLIENKDNWFGGDQEPANGDSRCALLAIVDTRAPHDVKQAARRSLEAQIGDAYSIAKFNNSHTHAEVRAAFDRAIALAKAGAA